MTSKEAMLELLGFIAFQVPIEKQEEWKEMLHTLQNDLDKLEEIEKIILDTRKLLDENTDPGMPPFIKAESYNKIKEVLENE